MSHKLEFNSSWPSNMSLCCNCFHYWTIICVYCLNNNMCLFIVVTVIVSESEHGIKKFLSVFVVCLWNVPSLVWIMVSSPIQFRVVCTTVNSVLIITAKSLIYVAPNPKTEMFLVLSCCCLCLIHWCQVLSWEWRCSWSSADRLCSNFIWVINNLIAYWGVAYIRGLMVLSKWYPMLLVWKLRCFHSMLIWMA